jgi:hypothetical protein
MLYVFVAHFHREDRHRVLYDFMVEFLNPDATDQQTSTASNTTSSPLSPSPQSNRVLGSDSVEGFFGVFDGHSGWMAAQYAAQFTPECIFSHLTLNETASTPTTVPSAVAATATSSAVSSDHPSTTPAPGARAIRWRDELPVCIDLGLAQIETEVLEHSLQMGHDSGSTAVFAIVVDGVVFVSNTGDSRCVMARKTLPGPSPATASTSKEKDTYPSDKWPPVSGSPFGASVAARKRGAPPPPPGLPVPPSAATVAAVLQCKDFAVEAIDLSIDQKPGRPDEELRIDRAGGSNDFVFGFLVLVTYVGFNGRVVGESETCGEWVKA